MLSSLILLYIISIGLGLFISLKIIRKEILSNDGIITLSFLVYNIAYAFIPIINLVIALAYLNSYLGYTNIKFNIKGKDEKR